MSTFAFLTFLLAPAAEPASRLAVIREAPGFTLTTQSGKKFSLTDLRGKVLLVGFVFTTCNGTCPATTSRMCRIHDAMKEKKIFRDGQARFLSITLDPDRDTPGVLRRYANLYDVDLSSWSFLTGSPAVVKKTFQAWGMWVKNAPNAQLQHPSRIFLVDKKGRIREIYNLSFLKTKWVVEDVELLLNER